MTHWFTKDHVQSHIDASGDRPLLPADSPITQPIVRHSHPRDHYNITIDSCDGKLTYSIVGDVIPGTGRAFNSESDVKTIQAEILTKGQGKAGWSHTESVGCDGVTGGQSTVGLLLNWCTHRNETRTSTS